MHSPVIVISAAILSAPQLLTAITPEDPATRRISAYLDAQIDAGGPGCVTAVYDSGTISSFTAHGLAEVENLVPLGPDSTLEIASVSKQFTAMAVHLLAHDGKLSLVDRLDQYFPELPSWAGDIRISQLLTHTSGIRDYTVLMAYQGVRPTDYYDTDDILALLKLQERLDFAPGSNSEYSNSGYVLAGLLVERVSGQSLNEFAVARIFGPLGMANTRYIDDHTAIIPHRAYGYTADQEDRPVRDVSPRGVVGDGGIVTTIADLQKWDENFYDNKLGGGKALISEMERVATLTDGTETDLASGLYVRNYRGLRQVSHTGNYGGFKALMARYPEIHRSFVLICNRDDISPTRMGRDLLPIVLDGKIAASTTSPLPRAGGAVEAPTPAPASAQMLSPGIYYSRELAVSWTILDMDGQLAVAIPRQEPHPLAVSGENMVSFEDAFFDMHVDHTNQFSVIYGGYSGIPFTLVTETKN